MKQSMISWVHDKTSTGTMGKTMQPSSLSLQLYKQYRTMTHRSKTKIHASHSATRPTTRAPPPPLLPVILPPIPSIITLLIVIAICGLIQPTYQQQSLCPKVCLCDEKTLETYCQGSILANRIPLTLNPSTKRITINHAQITAFSTLDYIKNLETLDLAYNRIASIDFVHINSNGNLLSLNASHNNLSELKDSTVSAAIIRPSDTSSDPFTTTDSEELEKLRALRKAKINVIELILSHNHITILRNFTFVRWVRLQRLDLSFNALVSLETEALYGLTKLKQLNLRGNNLIQVPGQAFVSTTKAMISVSSTNNQTVSQLRSLDLSENALVSLEPSSFYAIEQLQELHLDSCSLQLIHQRAFNELTTLNLLSLNNNDLTEMPNDSFEPLSSLKQLFLDANRIQQLRHYALRHLFNLEELHINNGSLRELEPNSLNGLRSLRRLSLSHNQNLTSVYANLLDDLPKLVHLSFYKSSLTSLPFENSANLENRPLTVLDLRDNPLKCDCQLKWLTKWLAHLNETVIVDLLHGRQPLYLDNVTYQNYLKNQFVDLKMANELVNISCTGPPALAGRPVVDLPDIKLECMRPTSSLNLHVGFASLFLMSLVLITACTVNFFRNERHFVGIIKENLAQNPISIMMPYSQRDNKAENFKKGEQMECAEYEPVDYGQSYGPIYTIPGDQQVLGNATSQQQTHQL